MIGCSPKPNNEEMGKLEQARAAAESAEKKLHELRQERMQLESELQGKQGELQATEKENAEISQ
jgi:chromosome segregation ATPase